MISKEFDYLLETRSTEVFTFSSSRMKKNQIKALKSIDLLLLRFFFLPSLEVVKVSFHRLKVNWQWNPFFKPTNSLPQPTP